jgi:hypothetical protein
MAEASFGYLDYRAVPLQANMTVDDLGGEPMTVVRIRGCLHPASVACLLAGCLT